MHRLRNNLSVVIGWMDRLRKNLPVVIGCIIFKMSATNKALLIQIDHSYIRVKAHVKTAGKLSSLMFVATQYTCSFGVRRCVIRVDQPR